MRTDEQVQNNVARLVIDPDRVVWTLSEIEAELPKFSNPELGMALTSLEDEGVLYRVGTLISASRCAQRLNELEMLIPGGGEHGHR